MNIVLILFAGLCMFHLLLVLARFRFVFALNPGGYQLLHVYINHTVNDDLHIYFGYAVFDIVRWGLTRTEGRTEFQVLLTFVDNNPNEKGSTDSTSAG